MKLALTRFSIKHPWLTLLLVLLVTAGLAYQLPKVHFDNDPENMLSPDEPVRLFHHRTVERSQLYDFVVVGIVNESHPDGIFNVATLGRIDALTRMLLRLHRSERGLPAVVVPATGDAAEQELELDLNPKGRLARLFNLAFHHDPNALFDANGESALIAREMIAPSVVDNIKQAEYNSLKLEYLMEHPPATAAEARAIRDDAMNNPLYAGTLVSEDGKALCLYLPLKAKHFSHNVANLVKRLTADWPAEDQLYITGLPVAEDTFGVEMLVQMATSAPLAGLAIFLLMFLFFRRVSLIVAPMIVAVLSIVMTMGLLIGLGYNVHIMSSMIAIFLMPIAVADAIHILSEFFDTYPRIRDKAETIKVVVGHLFKPMFYTSLTTIAGFASLATTPIPPVRIFGLHVAFGVAMAWILTMTLVPAYIMLFVPKQSLEALAPSQDKPKRNGGLQRFLEHTGSFSYRHAHGILLLTALLLVVSVFGILRIRVNDNPVKWFAKSHPIRVADEVLNRHFGGTYTAYISLERQGPEPPIDVAAMIGALSQWSPATSPDSLHSFSEAIRSAAPLAESAPETFADDIRQAARSLDDRELSDWRQLADELNYLDPEGLDLARLRRELAGAGLADSVGESLSAALGGESEKRGEALLQAALAVTDRYLERSLTAFLDQWWSESRAPLFKQPAMLRYLNRLTAYLEGDDRVGKTTSAVDALEKTAYELAFVDPAGGADAEQRARLAAENQAHFAVPDSAAAVAQVYSQLENMKKKDSLFHLVTRDYQAANVWVQLTSGDNKDMERVVDRLNAYMTENPPPQALQVGWAGLTYINVIWQQKMVKGMSLALGSSFLVVLVMMMLLFRNPIFGLLAMIPLTATITFTYGLLGMVGKEYDMPIAVLSALTLGLSVDFAIHFLQRAREMQALHGNWREGIKHMFKEPAMAISRNAITISVGFTPLLAAPLIPYKTVGFFLATVMAVSWVATLFILAALVTLLRRTLFKQEKEVSHANLTA